MEPILLFAACVREADPGPSGDGIEVDTDTVAESDDSDCDEPCPGMDPFDALAPNDPAGPLCDIPEDYVANGGDPVNPPCAIAAGGTSSQDRYEVPEHLVVATWNVRYGLEHAVVLDTLASTELADADFLLLQEVARHDLSSNPQLVDQAAEIAAARGMYFAFGVEWDRRENEDEVGEHGVAILSRYPLGNARLIRHAPQNDWWDEDERYGGRMTLAVDAAVGCTLVRLYSVHLDTRGLPSGRAEQGAEVREDADQAGRPEHAIVGGDFNTWTCTPTIQDCTVPPAAEPVVEAFLADGWADAAAGYGSYTQLGEGILPQRLDWIFARGPMVDGGYRVLKDASGSDHFPMLWRFSL